MGEYEPGPRRAKSQRQQSIDLRAGAAREMGSRRAPEPPPVPLPPEPAPPLDYKSAFDDPAPSALDFPADRPASGEAE